MNGTKENCEKNTDDSAWSDLCDDSLLQQLDEPFVLEGSYLRKDENYYGFDNNTGKTWIYPTNYPIRSYQYNITKAALFKNTLVVLPTGLGKTFIAAVVMYNIYRWYPMGKVVFMAPTRPLVAQQIESCRKVMGIPMSDTAEMTGKQNKKARRELWRTKRVFFATPQVVQSDISDVEQDFPFSQIKLIVVDEAHRAKGRYAYTEVVQTLVSRNPHFRILALSATPGRRVEDVAEVVRNLIISHLEIRWENSIDVSCYTHRKHVKVIPVSLGEEISVIRNEFIAIIDPYVRYLIENNAITGNVGNMSRGWMLMEQKRFREMTLHQKHPNQANINQNFSICVSLYYALELLERHGLRVFLSFFDDNSNTGKDNSTAEKFFVNSNPKLKTFLQKLRCHVGPNPFIVCDLSTNLSNDIEDIPLDFDFGHPKYAIAKKVVLEHFEKDKESRVIIFCEYRESVFLLHRLFLQSRPLIRPRIFVGQGGTGYIRAVTQKEQIEVMKDFRSGACNTLISTSVAEEGIDVGEVELIICFDINTSNPTRFTQRIGRTGRRKQGSVIVLAAEGKEHAVVKEVMATKDKTNQKIAKSREVLQTLYKNSPRLVPPEFNPKCLETLMIISEEEAPQQNKKKTGSKEVKPKRAKKDKKASAPEGTDVRTFFKQVDLDEGEREIFCTVKESHAPLPNNSLEEQYMIAVDVEGNSNELDRPSTSKCCNVKSNKLKKLFNEIKIRGKRLDNPPKTKTLTLSDILFYKNLSQDVKRSILENNLDFVREKYEAIKAVEAITDSDINENAEVVELKNEFSAMEDIFGSRLAIELFLSENRRRNNCHSTTQLENKFSGLFEGLENREFTDDVNPFINEKLQEYDLLELDDNEKSKSYEENSVSIIYNEECSKNRTAGPDDFDTNLINNFEDDDVFMDNVDNVENNSKYMSQWTQNNIKHQSTPLRKTVRKDKSALNNESPLMKCFAKYVENRTSPKRPSKPLVANVELEISKDFFDSDFENMEEFAEVNKNEKKEIETMPKIAEDDKDISEKLFEDDDFDDIKMFDSAKKRVEQYSVDTSTSSTNNCLVEKSAKPLNCAENCQTVFDNFIAPDKPTNKEIPEPKEDFFDDEFDEFIACSSNILTQIEKRAQPLPSSAESMIAVDRILEIVSERDESEKAKKSDVTNPELENFDLNDFLEPFNSEEDDDNDVVHPSQPALSHKTGENLFLEYKNIPNGLQNSSKIVPNSKVTTRMTLVDNNIMKENRTPDKNGLKKFQDNTSPSLFRRQAKFGRLRLFCSGSANTKSYTTESESNKLHLDRMHLKLFYNKHDTEISHQNKQNGFSQNKFEESVIGGFLKRRFRQVIDSESEEESSIKPTQKRSSRHLQHKMHRKSKRRRCEFFDDEAKVSGSDSSDIEQENTCDDGLSQFVVDSIVADEEAMEHSSINMQAKYLESVRSPHRIRGGFKIPEHRQFMDMSKICSQPVVEESLSAYKEDSFVVTDEEDVFDGENSIVCPLEQAEAILKAKRKARKNGEHLQISKRNPKPKRWRNLKCAEESSDDEVS